MVGDFEIINLERVCATSQISSKGWGGGKGRAYEWPWVYLVICRYVVKTT